MAQIVLPWPPASLSGHAKGHWRSKSAPTAKYREYAVKAALAIRNSISIKLGGDSDILVSVTFYPPNRMGDRVNFGNYILDSRNILG